MARKRALAELLAAAALLAALGFMFFVVPFVFERQCPEPDGHGSAPAPSPAAAAAGEEPVVCPRAVLLGLCCAVCFTAAVVACVLVCCCQRFDDGDDDNNKGEASGATGKKAGYYVAIADDLEAGTAGEGRGKN